MTGVSDESSPRRCEWCSSAQSPIFHQKPDHCPGLRGKYEAVVAERDRLREAAQAVADAPSWRFTRSGGGPWSHPASEPARRYLEAVLAESRPAGKERPPVEAVGGVPTQHGDRCDAGVHAAVSWTYVRGDQAEMSLLLIRRALKEPRGWWNPTDEDQWQAVSRPASSKEPKPS